ncbi:MAG: outer membrane beta-barrel protein [Kordiimonadaceae bacterium]|nr:outer membrane beta-barrel protein [Kordiimonadaceae bacterium]
MNRVKLTGIVTGIALAAALTTTANAQSYDERDGYYISAFTGLNFQSAATSTPSNGGSAANIGTGINLSPDNGFVLGGSVGYKFSSNSFAGLRIELEASYRENDVVTGQLVSLTGADATTFGGDTSSLAVMANILYDFRFLLFA